MKELIYYKRDSKVVYLIITSIIIPHLNHYHHRESLFPTSIPKHSLNKTMRNVHKEEEEKKEI